ncbi:hypothetical protein BGZ89_010219, partial [Linnemannia elongata]
MPDYLTKAGFIASPWRKEESVGSLVVQFDDWAWKTRTTEDDKGAVTGIAVPIPPFEYKFQNEGGEWDHHIR